MAQTLQTLSIISFAVAGVCLVLGIFFWFFFNIPTVIGDLSGRTARKSIAKMRAANERTGVKSYKSSSINVERGKLTGTMPDSGKLKKKKDVANNNKAVSAPEEDKTEAIGSEATAILGSQTTGLLVDENATAPLDTPLQAYPTRDSGKKLAMIEEVMFVHTDEVIG